MLENILININFTLLLSTTFLYWLQSAGFLSGYGKYTAALSGLFQTIFLIQRWITSGHFPLSNLYESLLFLCWSLTLFVVVNAKRLILSDLIGSLLMPMILLIHTFAMFQLPPDLKGITPLVPALQSNWLMMHVTVMILSYAALCIGCLFSVAYLIIGFFFMPQFQPSESNPSPVNHNQTIASLIDSLDNLSYRMIGLGFPLLTIGLLSGAVWANQTWGSYWSWDPKETWALITWFIFAIYLHTRFSKQWHGRPSAVLASFGFCIIWICYLGVNLMGKGLHSYGFFQA